MAQKLRSYLVEGFVSRDRLRTHEVKGLRNRDSGAWIEIGTVLSWGPKSAVEKAQRQSWTREDRAHKYRATRLTEKPSTRPPTSGKV
jgi:hypothetical protein